jgi:hypothetical protein
MKSVFSPRPTTEAPRPSSAARATRQVKQAFADFLYEVFMRIFAGLFPRFLSNL